MSPEDNNKQSSPESQGEQGGKVQLDDQELQNVEESKADQKVELDLDDAPFLDWDEEEKTEDVQEEEETQGEEEVPAEEYEEERPWYKKKLVFWGGGFFVFLVLAGLFGSFLLQTDFADLNSIQEKIGGLDKRQFNFDPFWVEYNQKDRINHLHLQITLDMQGKKLAAEVSAKRIMLRDEIYYFLKSKEVSFLQHRDNILQLKKGLLQLINAKLTQGSIDAILVQQYLME